MEKRDTFSRNNVLHLWPFTIHDLRGLGAKKFYGKFCAGSIDHISEWGSGWGASGGSRSHCSWTHLATSRSPRWSFDIQLSGVVWRTMCYLLSWSEAKFFIGINLRRRFSEHTIRKDTAPHGRKVKKANSFMTASSYLGRSRNGETPSRMAGLETSSSPYSSCNPRLPARPHLLQVIQSPKTATTGWRSNVHEDISHSDHDGLLCDLFWALC